MLRQVIAVASLNIRSSLRRWRTSLVIVVGLAGVVAVFTALLAMATGFETTLEATGRTDRVLILSGGSAIEVNSGLDRNSTEVLEQEPGIQVGADGKPLASAELVVVAELARRQDSRNGANITVRGVEPSGFVLRPQLRIIAGRNFKSGLRELIVGRGIVRQFKGAELGDVLRMRGSDWTVVGIFESGDAHESELWTDAGVARSAFGRGGSSSSVLAALDGTTGLDKLKGAIGADPRLSVDVVREQDYFSSRTKRFRRNLGFLVEVVTVIMALGAIFAALNSMYTVVASRSKEIATLRAIGFGTLSVVASVMLEALLLALVGGIVGVLIAYVGFNNLSTSTLDGNFTQVVFDFKVTPMLAVRGLVIAVVVGMIGGLLPAVRAARLPVTASLRES